ncbi:MAG TPA: hypothetical protein PKU86_02200 [Bacteroidales bacterium]|nr:hypothetical protein [Bacteroidales bacterium]HQQ02171.1 hypothetical protein [Bacteroidales bacterium]
MYRYQGKSIEVDTVYRFSDKLSDKLKPTESHRSSYLHCFCGLLHTQGA